MSFGHVSQHGSKMMLYSDGAEAQGWKIEHSLADLSVQLHVAAPVQLPADANFQMKLGQLAKKAKLN